MTMTVTFSELEVPVVFSGVCPLQNGDSACNQLLYTQLRSHVPSYFWTFNTASHV